MKNNVMELQKKIMDMIETNELFKDKNVIVYHITPSEMRIRYKHYIVIVYFEDGKIDIVNGFKFFSKRETDKLENINFYNQPDYFNWYHHHEHCEGYNPRHVHHKGAYPIHTHGKGMYDDVDTLQRPNPDVTLLHASLKEYQEHVTKEVENVDIVIKLIEAIITIRESDGSNG